MFKMPKVYEKEKIGLRVDQVIRLLVKGYISELKLIRKDSRTSGIVRVPSCFIGQRMKVILIPEDEIETLGL